MIHFDFIEQQLERLAEEFNSATPFEHVVLDDFADSEKLLRVLQALPVPGKDPIHQSRDYIFAKNKFEKGNFKAFSEECQELSEDLTSPRFQKILQAMTGQKIFVDPEFFGGGVHLGGQDSFLDLHTDFNYHPLHRHWFRNLNILLYLNPDWRKHYGGELKLKHAQTHQESRIEPLFNRGVIMFTRDYTLHGYDRINFPEGEFRRSIAAYAYSLHEKPGKQRSTRWMPEHASFLKKWIGNSWPALVKIKSYFFSSGTAKNR